ncbi:DUF2382 domain-containing protein [Aquipuribacter hungaricus]|uniref:DUF2382 domain-containing protein n=1 Tax=Aquipuribacter hungaricus TaxID=545624 RepID=A0ABV7WF97_9MICO
MDSSIDLTRVNGAVVVDLDGGTIGTAREVYLDDATGRPEWVTVHTGLLGGTDSFVPLTGAEISGDVLRVRYGKKVVKGSPKPSTTGHLTPEQETELYRYYGLAPGTPADATIVGERTDEAEEDAVAADRAAVDGPARAVAAGAPASAVTSGGTDDAMTVSEERLTVGTERHAVGRARLRKYVVTEMRTVEVEVRREEVRLEHLPAGGGDPATDGGVPYDGPPVDVTEADPVVVLHEERPVVTTETVPVERVRMATGTVTSTESVSGEVRREHVEVDADPGVEVDGAVADGPDATGRGERRRR